MQHWFAPDLRSVQPALTGGDALGLLVDEQAVSNLLAQARERALMQVEVVCEGGAVQLGLFLGLLVSWSDALAPFVNHRWQPRWLPVQSCCSMRVSLSGE